MYNGYDYALVAQRIEHTASNRGVGSSSLSEGAIYAILHFMASILTRKLITQVSNHLKESNFKVVLTHGSFDLFHIGHAEFLKESKKNGDYLIVGVESDTRIKNYKGQNRPIIPDIQRMEVLLGRQDIDFILPLEGNQVDRDYYLEQYESINPSIITFGRDFSFKAQYKTKRLINLGVRAINITHKYDNVQSTSSIIEKIRR